MLCFLDGWKHGITYRVIVPVNIDRKILSWGLSDSVLVDVHVMIREVLPSSPTTFLKRRRQPFDGMNFEFSLIDPQERTRRHTFVFLVTYGQDEETLHIAQCGYARTDGL